MPGMLGTELVEQVEAIRPELGVVFMSGYSHEVLAPEALAEQGRPPPSSRSRSTPASCCGPSAVCSTAPARTGMVSLADVAAPAAHPRHRRPAGDPAPDRAHPRRALRVRVRQQRRGGPREAGGERVRRSPSATSRCPASRGWSWSRRSLASTPRRRSSWSPGWTTPRSPSRAFELGAHGYLVKPFWPGQLLITTMNALRQRELELAQAGPQQSARGSPADADGHGAGADLHQGHRAPLRARQPGGPRGGRDGAQRAGRPAPTTTFMPRRRPSG